tara:strand:- start:156 stop:335 length:180 start_codon:yes stop_codon:yes gene_type:complete
MDPTANLDIIYEYKIYPPEITGKSLLNQKENKKIKDNHTILDFMKEFNKKKKKFNSNCD